MKTAKVEKVQDGIRKWDGPHGTVFYHSIVLDNGDFGEIGKKAAGAIKAGDELTYEITSNEYGNKIKAVQPQFNGGGKGRMQGSPASFALSYAKDMMVAAMPFHTEVSVSTWVDTALITAAKFQAFLKENE